MITLDAQVENQLNALASDKGLSISELIKNLIFNYQSEQESLDRADNSYADYKKTAKSTSLDQLMKNNDLDS